MLCHTLKDQRYHHDWLLGSEINRARVREQRKIIGTGGGNSGGSGCDLSNVTFSETVWPIINANCTSCHSGASPGGGILLTNHATVAAQGAIGSGNPGSLLGAITHAAGNSPMPQGQAKLSDCNISKIRTWINAGMPDN